jgi:hypothetical protein
LRRYLILALFASVSLTTPASAHDGLLHDASAGIHDVETAHRDEQRASRGARKLERDVMATDHAARDANKADRETASFVHEAMRVDGLLHEDHKESERKRAEDDRAKERELRKAECDRLELDYYLRHPPGTKPESLGGVHGCALYRADAHYHDTHPAMLSVFGDNIYLKP